MSELLHSADAASTARRLPYAPHAEDDTGTADDLAWMDWELDTEEILPGSLEQSAIMELFVQYLRTLQQERRWRSLIATEVFFAWVPNRPNVRVSPDVFICDDENVPRRGVVHTWEPGRKAPRFALEVVSKDRRKDYLNAPKRYDALGTNELAIFDPVAADSVGSLFPRSLTLYRRMDDGGFRKIYEGNGPIRSVEIGAWLLLGMIDGGPYLRIARDAAGTDLVPTPGDAAQLRAEAARQRAEAAQARADAEGLHAATEKSRAEKAEQRIRELEAQLRRG